MKRLFLSFLGTGFLKPAPGTWGSLAALPVGVILIDYGGFVGFSVAIVAVYFLGVHLVADVLQSDGQDDPGWIVIDEVAGQWVAMLPVVIGAAQSGRSVTALWPGILAAFVFFRLFDIWKPGPIGWVDRRKDATGVMLDDVLAGVFAALSVMVLAIATHAAFFTPPAGDPPEATQEATE
jgi:phosphatidylglycerophosphatase A